MSQTPPVTGALSVRQFCKEYSVSLAHARREIAAGRLPVRVLSPRKKLIERTAAEAWLRALPQR